MDIDSALLHSTEQLVLWLALALGSVVGVAAQRSHFCTMGGISDIISMSNYSRLRMWALAIVIAMIGTTGLDLTGIIDARNSIYLNGQLRWFSHVFGGLLFGFGMVLASGCGFRAFVKLGTGSLKALFVLIVMGVVALMTLRGIFAVVRVQYFDTIQIALGDSQSIAYLLSESSSIHLPYVVIITTLLLVIPLLLFVFWRGNHLTSVQFFGSVTIGLSVVLGWYISGYLGFILEHPDTLESAFLVTNTGRMESMSFVSPAAYILELLVYWTDASQVMTMGIMLTLGVILGAAISSLMSGTFALEGFYNAEDVANHFIGALLMGFGGITALGCTIGQGISALSVLSIGALISVTAIIIGAIAGVKYLEWRI